MTLEELGLHKVKKRKRKDRNRNSGKHNKPFS